MSQEQMLAWQSVVIADDHAIFRNALAMLLEQAIALTVVAQCDKLANVEKAVQTHTPTWVILDYHMPDGDALQLGKRLLQRYEIKLVFLTGTQSGTVLRQLLESGAHGVLHKELSPDELKSALATIAAGERAVSPQITEKIGPMAADFTDREFQLFRLLVQGQNTKEIASHLHISPRTVEKHRENLFKKAGVQNIAQLMELGFRLQIMDLEAGSKHL